MSAVDILAATRPDIVTVTCLGRRWTLTPRTAAEWVGVIAYDYDTLTGVMPGAIDDDDLDAMWELSQHNEASEQWAEAARTAVAYACGRDWWWGVNLVRKAVSSWPYINGLLLLRGVNARMMPLAEWLDATYMLLWERGDEDARAKLDLELQLPPQGVALPKAQARKMLEGFAAI